MPPSSLFSGLARTNSSKEHSQDSNLLLITVRLFLQKRSAEKNNLIRSEPSSLQLLGSFNLLNCKFFNQFVPSAEKCF
jgi:hypothetical protein